jgi:hypothetical protein
MKNKIFVSIFLLIFSISGFSQITKSDTIAYAKYLKTKYGAKYAKHIANEEIILGMTREMVVESWGIPQGKTEKTDASGVFEKWAYAIYKLYDITWVCNYVYFKDGIVTGWKLIN